MLESDYLIKESFWKKIKTATELSDCFIVSISYVRSHSPVLEIPYRILFTIKPYWFTSLWQRWVSSLECIWLTRRRPNFRFGLGCWSMVHWTTTTVERKRQVCTHFHKTSQRHWRMRRSSINWRTINFVLEHTRSNDRIRRFLFMWTSLFCWQFCLFGFLSCFDGGGAIVCISKRCSPKLQCRSS